MTLLFIRIMFSFLIFIVSFWFGLIQNKPLLGAAIGVIIPVVLIIIEASSRRVSVRGLSSIVFGLLLGVLLAKLIVDILELILLPLGDYFISALRIGLTLVFSYLGTVMALRGKDEFHLVIPYMRFKRQDVSEGVVLLDTSALIDGRIADLYKTNFFTGRIVVPRFVLHELQKLADSDSSTKRQKGRRGMEILRKMQKDSSINVRIHEEDIAEDRDVDTKLVRLAKMLDARIYTTDYNLNRVATIQGVGVLNVNEVVNAVKLVIFAGEELDVRLLREGKEPNQAVAYTDDGTMIVVSDARRFIGKKVHVEVTSVLQTQAGRIIFAKIK